MAMEDAMKLHIQNAIKQQVREREDTMISQSMGKNPTISRDRSIFIGGWDRCILNFHCEKSWCPNKQKTLSYQCWGWKKLKFCDYFSKKKYVSYRFLHWSRPPNEYWPVPNRAKKLHFHNIVDYFSSPDWPEPNTKQLSYSQFIRRICCCTVLKSFYISSERLEQSLTKLGMHDTWDNGFRNCR